MRKLTIKKDKKFGRLTIIKEVKPRVNCNGDNIRRVLCKCDCGNKKEIDYYNLTKNNYTKSCGCLNIEKSTKHNMSHDRFYTIFHDIKKRCFNKNCYSYKNYGGRGIKCKWKSFESFKKDMYESYKKHLKQYGKINTSIERKDNNKNYCKKNCLWATRKEQMNNTRNNHLLTHEEQTLTMMEWSEKLDINYWKLKDRINKYKWSVKKALLTK